MRPFKELRVWRLAHELALLTYQETRDFPQSELYGLTSQMRRSAASIAANIAEGSARLDTEFPRFLRIALGSAAELQYHTLLARDLGYLTDEQSDDLDVKIDEVKGMLVRLMRSASQPHADGRRLTADGPRSATQ
jgi:four helix bundle protein